MCVHTTLRPWVLELSVGITKSKSLNIRVLLSENVPIDESFSFKVEQDLLIGTSPAFLSSISIQLAGIYENPLLLLHRIAVCK